MKIIKNNFYTDQNKSLKILVLSDLHIYNEKSIKILNNIKNYLNKNKYDVVCLVGDIIDSTNMLSFEKNTYEKLLEFIEYLGNYAKTYIVYGSHDISYRNYKKRKWEEDFKTFKSKFLNKISKYKGIKILENETMCIDDGYTISGFNPSFKYANTKNDEEIFIKEGGFEFLKKLNHNNTNIFLCHYPNVVMKLFDKGYLDNVDLSISGHNHNGMTQLKVFPLEKILNSLKQNNRGIITPSKSLRLNNTNILRGNVKLNNRTTLIINPSITSLAKCTGLLNNFNCLFYSGATEINFIPEKEN